MSKLLPSENLPAFPTALRMKSEDSSRSRGERDGELSGNGDGETGGGVMRDPKEPEMTRSRHRLDGRSGHAGSAEGSFPVSDLDD